MDVKNLGDLDVMGRGIGLWPFGDGQIMSGKAVTDNDKLGLFVMLAVPDWVPAPEDWRSAVPGKHQFDLLLTGDGPMCVLAFKTPDDVQRVIDTLRALKHDMMEAR